MSHKLGDGPIDPEFQEIMVLLAKVIDNCLNQDRNVGFVLLVFPYGEKGGRCNYVSNGAERRDMVNLLREQANRFEAELERGVVVGKVDRK